MLTFQVAVDLSQLCSEQPPQLLHLCHDAIHAVCCCSAAQGLAGTRKQPIQQVRHLGGAGRGGGRWQVCGHVAALES